MPRRTRSRAPLRQRRSEREFFFWTIHRWLGVALSVVLVIELGASVGMAIYRGDPPPLDRLLAPWRW